MLSKVAVPALLCFASTVLHAAEQPITQIEPVVVTATRFEERYTDKPVNLVVITAEDIRSSPAKTVPDLLSEQAGISVHDLFGNNAATTTVDMRGFGVTGTQNTLILVDGRRVVDIDLSGVQWSAVPLQSIDRIEIVRGGGSVLYGEGATAGVINIITKSPKPGRPELTLRGSVGSYDTHEIGAQANLPLGPASLALLGSEFESGGYRRNNRNRQANALADLRWSGAPGDFALKLSADNQGIRLPGARLVQPSAGIDLLETDRRGTATPLDWAQREGRTALFDWRRRTGFGEFLVEAGWREKEQRAFFAFDGFPDFRDTDLTVWSLTPRMKIDVPIAGRPNTLTAGIDWYSWDYDLRRSNSQANIVQPFNRVHASEDTVALYALDTMNVTDSVSVSAGARRERFHIDANDRFDPTAPGGAFGSGAPAGSQRLYQNAYELGARYQVAPAVAFVAKTARSYRFANVDEIYETSAQFTNEFQFLRPQTSRSHEVSVEARRASLRTRLTAFRIDVDDEIHLDPFTTGVGNRNLPPSRREGLELEMQARPHPQLNVAAAYTYINAKFREGVLAGSAFTQQDVNIAGKAVPLVPRHKLNVRVAWEFTPATRLAGVATYVSDQFMDNDEPNNLGTKIPSYTVVDFKLTHRAGDWLIAASLNNVLNEKYYNYAVRSQFVADRYNAYPLPERNGMVTAEYRFH